MAVLLLAREQIKFMSLENRDLIEETRAGIIQIQDRRHLRTKILDAFQQALGMIRREHRESTVVSLPEYKDRKRVLGELTRTSGDNWISLKGIVVSREDRNSDGSA